MAGEDRILEEIRSLGDKVQDVRERIIRIETHGYHERLTKVEEASDSTRDRLTVLETQGRIFTAGVSAAVALIVSALGAFISYLFGKL
jgi:hypothetical protein